jgi:hypothetical protein
MWLRLSDEVCRQSGKVPWPDFDQVPINRHLIETKKDESRVVPL